jgi:hypothetical protein
MKTLAYIALGLSTAAVMFAGSYLAHLRDRSEVGTSAIGFEGGDGADRDAEVERERQIVLARLAAKLHITQAVIEHKVSLLEAAYQVRELVSTDSRALASLRGAFPDCSEEEMFCRHVITIVPLAPLEKSVAASEVARLASAGPRPHQLPAVLWRAPAAGRHYIAPATQHLRPDPFPAAIRGQSD